MVTHRLKQTFVFLAAVVPVLAVLAAAGAEQEIPTSEQVMNRILNANAGGPVLTSADAHFKFRMHKPVSLPPDCEFSGAIVLREGRQQIEIGRRTSGLQCWALNHFIIGRLFQGTEPPAQFLSRFTFWVLGWRLVDGHLFYLVEGTARNPKNNPYGMIGWVDYDRGLIVDGTIKYSWGDIDGVQRYEKRSGAWVLVYQYLMTSRFGASLEVEYSNFQFQPR